MRTRPEALERSRAKITKKTSLRASQKRKLFFLQLYTRIGEAYFLKLDGIFGRNIETKTAAEKQSMQDSNENNDSMY